MGARWLKTSHNVKRQLMSINYLFALVEFLVMVVIIMTTTIIIIILVYMEESPT